MPDSSGRWFHPNDDRLTMIVDSLASDMLCDDKLISSRKESMGDVKKLE